MCGQVMEDFQDWSESLTCLLCIEKEKWLDKKIYYKKVKYITSKNKLLNIYNIGLYIRRRSRYFKIGGPKTEGMV